MSQKYVNTHGDVLNFEIQVFVRNTKFHIDILLKNVTFYIQINKVIRYQRPFRGKKLFLVEVTSEVRYLF